MNNASKALTKRRAEWPRVRQVKMKGKSYWLVDARIGGEHGRRHYRDTLAEATALAEQLCTQHKNVGGCGLPHPGRGSAKRELRQASWRKIVAANQNLGCSGASGCVPSMPDDDCFCRLYACLRGFSSVFTTDDAGALCRLLVIELDA